MKQGFTLLFAVTALLLFLCHSALSDVIKLKNGGTITGKIVQKSDDDITVRTQSGASITISIDEVESVLTDEELQKECDKRFASAETADDFFELGEWCESVGLKERAETAYAKALQLDPNHENTRLKLGYKKHEGKWLSEEEYNAKVKGLVKYKDKWVTPQEKEKLEQGYEKVGDEWVRAVEVSRAIRYAVVVSSATRADADWAKVVDALKEKYGGEVFEYSENIDQAREKVAAFYPTHICFVLSRAEAISGGEELVRRVHQFTRKLDDDPYGDAVWAILTGYDASDALRIASQKEPLKIRSAFLKTSGGWLDYLQEGEFFSEGKTPDWWVKRDGKIEKKTSPLDTTEMWVELLNKGRADFVLTSGHATEHDWQAGYANVGRIDGQIRSKEGNLTAIDTKRSKFKIESANPKVYFGMGNCLIGHISDADCMALAWIHSGGAYQFCGYTVSTWYGHMWGLPEYFFHLQDRFTFAECFFINNQALIYDLENNSPGMNEPLYPQRPGSPNFRQGHEYDKDTVALYGDPAWEARIEKVREPLYNQKLTVQRKDTGAYVVTFEIEFNYDYTAGDVRSSTRPAFAFLPIRAKNPKVTFTDGRKVVVTDNFILMKFAQKGDSLSKGQKRKAVFTCEGE
jgi:zinc protease